MKDVIIAFLLGIIVGIISIVVIELSFIDTNSGSTWPLSRASSTDKASNPDRGSVAERIKDGLFAGTRRPNNKPFHLDFESASDLKFFQLTDGLYAELSSERVSSGRHSLFLEFPEGASFPGLYWEVFSDRKLLDFSGAKAFGFDAFNNNVTDTAIVIKIKANKNYPKDVFEKTVVLESGKWNKIRIPISELAQKLDISKISYIKIFIPSPKASFEIFLDNFGLFRGEKYSLYYPHKRGVFFYLNRPGQPRLSPSRQG